MIELGFHFNPMGPQLVPLRNRLLAPIGDGYGVIVLVGKREEFVRIYTRSLTPCEASATSERIE
jgi:hypothetical protein